VAREIPNHKEISQVPKPKDGPDIKGIGDGAFDLKDRMPDDAPVARTDPHPRAGEPASRLIDNQPAMQFEDWLPQGLFPEIDKLREEHIDLLRDHEAGEKVQALREQYEGEDAARAEALRTGGEVPTLTPYAERQDTFGAAEAEREAKNARLDDFLHRAIATFARMEPEWREKLRVRAAEAQRKQEEAKAALAAADLEAAKVSRLEIWLTRTVTPFGGRYQSAPEVAPVEDVDEFMRVAP
jgi:hypothetical protein